MTIIYTGEEGERIRHAMADFGLVMRKRSKVYLAVLAALSC
jgi:hypothetical protein